MLSFLRAYKKFDPAAGSLLEIALAYPGPKAVFFHRIAHTLNLARVPIVPRMVAEFSRFMTGIEIHPGARIGARLVIDHGMGVVIGQTAIIGDDCLIYQGVTLGGRTLTPGKRHPTLGDDVVIGAGAKVLGNIEIGSKSRIGPNTVVIESLVPGSTVVSEVGHLVRRSSQSDNVDYVI